MGSQVLSCLEVREMFLILLFLAVPSTFAQFTLTVKNAKELDLNISNTEKFHQYMRSLREIYKKQGYVLPVSDYLHRSTQMRMAVGTDDSLHPFALPASCRPQSSVVAIEVEAGVGEHLYPSCTRLDVILVDTINNTDRVVTANMTEHKSCQCRCKVQRPDCSPLQVYYPDLCLCQCSNWLERILCGLRDDNKLAG